MTNTLLTSEAFVKSATSVSDNLSNKYLLSSIREAQEIRLKEILGDCLLEKLKILIRDHQLTGVYQVLVERCQYFLAYTAIVDVAYKVSYKVGNFGIAKSTDENLQVASSEEINRMQFYYQSKADACCVDLQKFLLAHKTDYPELTESCCRKMESNLYSAASCGIFLGGARGRRVRR